MLATLLPLTAAGQIVGFPTEEDEPDTILKLEDLVAQCADPSERSVFQYVQNAKRLSWYRSEWFSAEREIKLNGLMYGIQRKDTGRPAIEGYADVRDLPDDSPNKSQPYQLSRNNYPDFGWVRRPKPNYTSEQCRAAARGWKLRLADVDKGIREPFPELSRYVALTDPTAFLSISRLIGDCQQHIGRQPPFINSTSFEAWLSDNFSRSYGKQEKLSRPLYDQLRKELQALGGMAKAARGFALEKPSQSECNGVTDRLQEYFAKHRLL